MKRIFLLALLSICHIILTANVIASPMSVELISSDFHIWGGMSGYVNYDYPIFPEGPEYYEDNFFESYDQSATLPLTGGVELTAPYPVWVYAYSSTDFFSVDVVAEAEEPYTLSAQAFAYAQAEWVFSPLYDSDDLTVSYGSEYGIWGGIDAYLKDLTDGTTLWSLDLGMFHDEWVPWGLQTDIIPIAFKSDHVYALSFLASVGANNDATILQIKTTDIQIFNDIQSVPEPATMLLLGSGLLGLFGIRRRLKK